MARTRKRHVRRPRRPVRLRPRARRPKPVPRPAAANPARRYWKFSPGRRGAYWEQFRDLALIGLFVRTADCVDLRKLRASSCTELRKALARRVRGRIKDHPELAPVWVVQLWRLYHEMRPGDLVCAYSNKQVFGWGEIVGEYEFGAFKEFADFSKEDGAVHYRKVRWISTDPIRRESLSPDLQKRIGKPPTIFELKESDFEEFRGKSLRVSERSQSKPRPRHNSPGPELLTLLSDHLSARGLSFTPWQIATFYTALQTKGFVILTGITGTGKTKLAQHFALLLPQPHGEAGQAAEENWLFLPVRPDWRDGKPLLGYYNPLVEQYQGTAFLRFLHAACQSFQAEDGLAWFLILDEMNLAHVEYYFADLLSVLESGRDEAGWSREPLRLEMPARAAGSETPANVHEPWLKREIHLPPNLYVVGTVNTDETTYAFSPKVLDRAFTIELTEVDFSEYPPAGAEKADPNEEDRRKILRSFTCDGRFARIDKKTIRAYLGDHQAVSTRLQQLNALLRPHDLHFGYRVFDEIVCFLAAAEGNGLFAGIGGQEAALDAAVLMKVLPKFHGSRAKLEKPLRAVLAWCVNPDEPDLAALPEEPDAEPAPDGSKYRRTAQKALTMLKTLLAEGFAAFA